MIYLLNMPKKAKGISHIGTDRMIVPLPHQHEIRYLAITTNKPKNPGEIKKTNDHSRKIALLSE